MCIFKCHTITQIKYKYIGLFTSIIKFNVCFKNNSSVGNWTKFNLLYINKAKQTNKNRVTTWKNIHV